MLDKRLQKWNNNHTIYNRNDVMQVIEEKYRIVRELGSGGEGKVYLVQHRLTEQFRAAKVIRNRSDRRRFQELNAMKKLEHHGLPQIYDVLEENNQTWLIMEYVRGRGIHELDAAKCSQRQFFSIAKQLAEILVYLHTREVPVFHLDIKPSNLLLREDGTLVLIDFGIAIRQTCTADLSEQEALGFGTPGFAAPEQFRRGRIDGRSDLYGAGAVLYYYLFRMKPYKDAVESKRMLYRRLWKKGIRNPAVIWILQKCLCRNPNGRFADARAFQKAVCLAERSYEYSRKAGSTAAALLFLLAVSFFAVHQLKDSNMQEKGSEMSTEKNIQQQYQMILEQADQLGLVQAIDCYQEASHLAGESLEWLHRLLDRLLEDFSFDLEEERILKEVLFRLGEGTEQTVLEQIRLFPDFGELAYRIGIAYWHYYDGAGGKRAAAGWFAQAVSAADAEVVRTAKSWFQQAQIYERIGQYYEKLGKTDENGISQASMLTYWEDIKSLWQMEDRCEQSFAIQRQLAEELLFCLIFYPHELKNGGKRKEELQLVLKEIEQFQADHKGAELAESCHSAKAAVERVYRSKITVSQGGLNETD